MSAVASVVDSWVSEVSFLNVALALVAVWFLKYLLTPGPRRTPSRPAVPHERKVPRGTGQKIKVTNAATNEPLGEDCRAYTPEEVRRAYQDSKAAAEEWSKTPFSERKALLMDIMDWVVENQETIAQWSAAESGKTVTEASLGEVMTTCEKIRWIVASGEGALAPESRPVASLLATKTARVEYFPCGVIGVIVPWNYPVHNVLSAVVAALFAGNGAVVKVSEYTSWTAGKLENVLRKIIARRGYNPDLVQVITGYGETGAALVQSGVEKVLFIGSPAVGKLVMQGASKTLTPVILELGGKDPFIVFDDVDFKHCIDIAVRGAFINCGQNCVAAERFYVQNGVYDKFVEAVKAVAEKAEQGASCTGKRCDFGAITMPAQADHVEALVKEAVSKGARILTGGRKYKLVDGKKQYDFKQELGVDGSRAVYFEPTILADVTHEMEIANEETFGPVMTLIKFKTEDEVIRMANCTNYGLGSSVFTKDYKKASRVASALVTGMVTVNDFAMVPMIQSLPFGGVKHSGFGCFNGKEGLRGFSYRKAIVSDRFPIRMDAPAFLQYPVAANSPDIVRAGVRMIYGKTWLESVVSFGQMMKIIMFGGKK